MNNTSYGEAFRLVTKEGLIYKFDYALERAIEGKRFGIYKAPRYLVMFLVSRIEDRNGNYVAYTYNGNSQIASIVASDGRRIDVDWNGNKVFQLRAHGRTWKYLYEGEQLIRVEQPDASTWQYLQTGSLAAEIIAGYNEGLCYPLDITRAVNYQINAPSGAILRLKFDNRVFYKSGVPHSCIMTPPDPKTGEPPSGIADYTLSIPYFFQRLSLSSKELSGLGLPTRSVAYNYNITAQSTVPYLSLPCTACTNDRATTVTEFDGSRTDYIFGIKYEENEGKLLGEDIYVPNGITPVRSARHTFVSKSEANAMPFPQIYGTSKIRGLDELSTYRLPQKSTVIHQDSTTFTTQTNSFDAFARPVQVERKNNAGYSRTEHTTYHDNLNRWILGQVASVQDATTGIVESSTTYDATTALPIATYSFGKLQEQRTYYGDGNLATVKDGKGNTTVFTNWKRGVPQNIAYADGTATSAVVNDRGLITSMTDELGIVTSYEYDLMGRLTKINYPTNDSVAWLPTTYSFAPNPNAFYGLPAGHWVQQMWEGDKRIYT